MTRSPFGWLSVSILLILIFLGPAPAAETPPEPPSGQDPVLIDGLPPVPNPIGFDARLALRTHLEEVHGMKDCAGLDWAGLVERYRSVHAPAPDRAALEAAQAAEAAALQQRQAEQARRDNITLQLQRQFGATVDANASNDDLQRQLDAHLLAARAKGDGAVRPPPPAAVTPKPVVRRSGPEMPLTEAPPEERPVPAAAPPPTAAPTMSGGIVDGGRSYTADSQRRIDTLVAHGAAAGLTMLVVFETDGCMWCDKLNGLVGPLLRQQKERLAVIRVRIASGESQRFATEKEVLAYPTLFKYVQGRETGRLQGCPMDADALKRWLGLE